MAYVELDASKPQTNLFRQQRDALVAATNVAMAINRQMDQMTDEQVTAQFGIPAGLVAAFRTNIDSLLTALSSTAVINFISSMGFNR